jgi:hypothetical protein
VENQQVSTSLVERNNMSENREKAARECNRRMRSKHRNVTLMLIVISAFYILGNIPYSVYLICRDLFSHRLTTHSIRNMYFVSQCALYFLVISKFAVHFCFIKPFRTVFVSYFSRCFKKTRQF